MPSRRIPVAVLGATGTVGQKLVSRLERHPWFEIALLGASESNVGRRYGEAVRWREPRDVPAAVVDQRLVSCQTPVDIPLVFSALDTNAAAEIEPRWAGAGSLVVTNASPFRLAPDVPLLIPEVNPDHVALLDHQRRTRGWTGGIVANPNCTTTGLVLALAPIKQHFGLHSVFVSTMQAISGAGWPGVASLDIQGNVVPFIENEEEKVERETQKLFGTLAGDSVRQAALKISVHTNRVPVLDGHTECLSVGTIRPASAETISAALTEWRPEPVVAALPSTPDLPIWVDHRVDRPQPRLDLGRGDGMTVVVGRVRPCPLLDVRMVILSHNTVRGAAGATIQNAELLVQRGYLTP